MSELSICETVGERGAPGPISPFYTYKLSVVYRYVGDVGGGYNSGGFPISYYITIKSLNVCL